MYACIRRIGRGFIEEVCTQQRDRSSPRPTPTPRFANRLWRYALALLRRSGILLVANTGFREAFYSPTLVSECLPIGLRPHPVDTRRNNPYARPKSNT